MSESAQIVLGLPVSPLRARFREIAILRTVRLQFVDEARNSTLLHRGSGLHSADDSVSLQPHRHSHQRGIQPPQQQEAVKGRLLLRGVRDIHDLVYDDPHPPGRVGDSAQHGVQPRHGQLRLRHRLTESLRHPHSVVAAGYGSSGGVHLHFRAVLPTVKVALSQPAMDADSQIDFDGNQRRRHDRRRGRRAGRRHNEGEGDKALQNIHDPRNAHSDDDRVVHDLLVPAVLRDAVRRAQRPAGQRLPCPHHLRLDAPGHDAHVLRPHPAGRAQEGCACQGSVQQHVSHDDDHVQGRNSQQDPFQIQDLRDGIFKREFRVHAQAPAAQPPGQTAPQRGGGG